MGRVSTHVTGTNCWFVKECQRPARKNTAYARHGAIPGVRAGQYGTLPRLRSRSRPRPAAAPWPPRCGLHPATASMSAVLPAPPAAFTARPGAASSAVCDRVGVASSRRAHEIRATSLGLVLTIVSTAKPPEKGSHCNVAMPHRKGDCRPARSTIVPPSRQGQARSSAVDCSTDARARGCAVTSLATTSCYGNLPARLFSTVGAFATFSTSIFVAGDDVFGDDVASEVPSKVISVQPCVRRSTLAVSV